MGLSKAYLVAYNTACLLGWGGALLLAILSLCDSGGDLTKVWGAAGVPLRAAQWAMLLEIVHALTGMVRSPVLTVIMQVSSRIGLLVVLLLAPALEASWPVGMMAISWSLAEVVRYAFYVNCLLGPGGQTGSLYPIFWLRYSAFAILYPSGISGEVLTLIGALSDETFKAAFDGWAIVALKFVLVMYIPASPFMYLNMVGNRKSAFKKRFAKPPPPPVGVEFPTDDKGGRSTSGVGKTVIATAIAATGVADAKASAERCAKERNWRFGYSAHIERLVRLSCESPEAACASAAAGLDWMYANMLFYSADKKLTGSVGETLDKIQASFHTGLIRGGGEARQGYRVPYDAGWHPTSPRPPPADKPLTGAALKAQALKWAEKGVIEPDAAAALCWTSDYFDGGGSLKDVYVVMIGAGSAMGPFPKLLEMGATVVAIDIPGNWGKGARATSSLWRRLCTTAKNSPGSLVFPLSKPQSEYANEEEMYQGAGCDLMKQPAEIANWLCEWQKTIPSTAKVIIGNYTYLDGELHVKLALCSDYCIKRLRAARPSTGVAFLCTPTDIHVCTDASDQAARANYGSGFGSFGLEKLAHFLSGGKFLIPNFNAPVVTREGKQVKYVDGIALAQGPNYALAKRMQHWRAMLEFQAGAVVSSMVAPSTATLSVLHNKSFAWVYGGMPYFKYEIFKQDTTNAVMAAMLMHDILNKDSPKNPANKAKHHIENPIELFSTQAVHGGLWRSPYKVDSIGEVSALIYFASLAKPYLLFFSAAAVAWSLY
ncbi:hypothetical protein AB1Y20_007234 [Prymnesium parvum]|uniref:very-long-chain (3R)-3-hydroxyacyl-CoA dehydratase n=1 Tax=Prymnesium parvum TaxID=97485 RepID=A0AB34IUV9_PRYPA